MTNQSPSPRAPLGMHRVSELRHDLRNPLGEILGFTEVLMEEARERNLPTLVPGLESIRQAAMKILSDVDHTLKSDAVRLQPEVLTSLGQTIQTLSGEILRASQELSARCKALNQDPLDDDLVRISGAARRLREISPGALENLLGAADSIDPFATPIEPSVPYTAGPPAVMGTVLVVDDQESNRALLSRRLEKRGYTVILAENGRHAMERLRSRRFDLVLLDILMPEMDGVEVLRQIKADPELAHIPVVMLSALDQLDAVVQCIELGAEDYLPKPFPSAILHARVHACLVNKRMSDQLRKYTGWLFGKTLFANAVTAPSSLVLSRQERTILFADIRGFTRWSESHTPEEAVAMLNAYFEAAERLWANSSVIKTEYTGDEIMGVFPSAEEAVRIAQILRLEIGELLKKWGLGIGVGVHTGSVIEGLMGGAEVKAYRFVGDTVNTAKRICSEAQAGQVLIGEVTLAQAGPTIVAGTAFTVPAKGKAEPLKVSPLVELAAAAV